MKKLLIFFILISVHYTATAADRALVVGIGQYTGHGITPLPSPLNDLKESQALAKIAMGFNQSQIRVLYDSQATRKNILDSIDNWLIKGSSPGDNIYFYYSGHGTQVRDLNGDEEDGSDEAIIPYDAFINNSKQLINHITDDELDMRFKQLENRHVISVFDSCNSGTVTRGLGNREELPVRTIPVGQYSVPSQAFLNALDENTVVNSPAFQQARNQAPFVTSSQLRTVWSAASATQFAYVDPFDPNRIGGKYTKLLYDGFIKKQADQNRNGIITNSEMHSYVAQQSDKFCKQLQRTYQKCNFGLTPVLSIAPEIRNMKFGFPDAAVSSVSTQTPGTTVSDTLPENDSHNVQLFLETSAGKTTQVPHMESIYIVASGKKDGYLYLLDHDSDNEVRFLFPSGSESNYVKANSQINVPDPLVHNFSLQAFKKGRSELVAVLVEDPIDTSQLMREVRGMKPLSEKQIGDFASKIVAIHVGDRTNRLKNYSIKRLPYYVN